MTMAKWVEVLHPGINGAAPKPRIKRYFDNLSRKPRRTIRPVNKERAAWALQGVTAFQFATHMIGEDFGTIASDFLADLMHLCDQRGYDFDDLVRRALAHYTAEQSARTDG